MKQENLAEMGGQASLEALDPRGMEVLAQSERKASQDILDPKVEPVTLVNPDLATAERLVSVESLESLAYLAFLDSQVCLE